MGLRNGFLVGTAFVAAVGMGTARADELRVVASIKPIHSLVAGVMEGVGAPILLVEGAGSPHTYSLRPSAAAALEDADAVFWVGEGLEPYLTKPLDALSSDARVIELSTTEGLTLLETREGGVWDDHAHEDDHDDERAEFDMHVWLDPHNARAMVERIAAVLSDADLQHAETFAANAAAYQARLAELDDAIREQIAPVGDRPFVVFHDAYQYFERRYDLNAAGSIALNPERRPGARRLGEIRDRLAELDAACVFAEPQFEPALVRTVVEGTGARTGTLDPLGAGLDAGPELYFELMNRLARSMVDCLGGAQSG